MNIRTPLSKVSGRPASLMTGRRIYLTQGKSQDSTYQIRGDGWRRMKMLSEENETVTWRAQVYMFVPGEFKRLADVRVVHCRRHSPASRVSL